MLSGIDERVGEVLAVDVMEMYSPERVAELCGRLGLKRRGSFDLTNGFDFDTAVDSSGLRYHQEGSALISDRKPAVRLLQHVERINQHLHRSGPALLQRFNENLEKAKRHVRCC